jgi:phosphate transport system permease protein
MSSRFFGWGRHLVSEFCGRVGKDQGRAELLAAIPSVVWGFIGLTVMNPLIIRIFDAPIGLNVLNGGVILALMSVPIIVSIGEDALRAVPDSFREAALALGATRWQTVYRVLLPAARTAAAAVLGIGRRATMARSGHRARAPDPRGP